MKEVDEPSSKKCRTDNDETGASTSSSNSIAHYNSMAKFPYQPTFVQTSIVNFITMDNETKIMPCFAHIVHS